MSSNPFSKYIYHKNILPLGLTLIIAIMVFTSILESKQRQKDTDIIWTTVEQQELRSQFLRNMSYSVSQRTIVLTEMLHSDDPFLVDELSMNLRSLATEYVSAITELSKLSIDTFTNTVLYEIDQLNRKGGPVQYKVSDLLLAGEKDKATALFVNKAYPSSKKVFGLIKEIEAHLIGLSNARVDQMKVASKKHNYDLNIQSIIGIVLTILLTILIISKQSANDRKLAYQAITDTLTELPNRKAFIDSTNKYIKLLGPDSSETFAIVFFDVDYFKSINDNYGHEVGDQILRLFSSRIMSAIGKKDILSRFGGDEFVLLLTSIKSEQQAIDFVQRLSEALDSSFMVNEQEVFFSASIGLSLYSSSIPDAQSMLKNADIAMYMAKESGRNCYKLYSEETSVRMKREHEISHALRTTLKEGNVNNELYIMYQPLLNIQTGKTTECEALIRWITAEGEVISPDDFIPLAEKSNIIEKINLFVIDETCKQQCEWQKISEKNIRININLSGNKAIFRKLLKQFKNNLDTMNLSPTLFGIELTERTLHEICEETINELDELRRQGVKISIDDFGTDYSSLMYLRKLPVTTLKIDKGFIDGLPNDQDSMALVTAIITLGHSLNLDIVAEGVETIEQLEFLKSHSCNTIQGYYYQHPLYGKELTKLELVA